MTKQHRHKFVTGKDGVDRCACGVTFLEHARGFGGNTMPSRIVPSPLTKSKRAFERERKSKGR